MPHGEYDRQGDQSTAQDRVREALQTLDQGIDSIVSSERFATYLRTLAKFHHYSSANVALILMQAPAASQVAGYRRWQELGRQVRKGEKGIKILVPYKRRTKPENDEEEERVMLRGFGVGTVFDVSSTDGDPLPEPPPIEVVNGASDVGMRLYVDLLDYVELHGVSAVREHTAPSNGYFDPGRRYIAIGHHIDGDQATKTLTHETAHMVAQHTMFDLKQDVETVAESAAYVVLSHYGIDSSGYSFPYVARWAQDRAVFKRNLEAIQRVSHEIIRTLQGTREQVVFERRLQ